MTKKCFNDLCVAIKHAYDKKKGLIVRFSNKKETIEFLLCMITTDNTSLVVNSCFVWKNDELVYNGSILDKKLKKLLEENKVCRAKFTDYKNVDNKEYYNQIICITPKKTCACGYFV